MTKKTVVLPEKNHPLTPTPCQLKKIEAVYHKLFDPEIFEPHDIVDKRQFERFIGIVKMISKPHLKISYEDLLLVDKPASMRMIRTVRERALRLPDEFYLEELMIFNQLCNDACDAMGFNVTCSPSTSETLQGLYVVA